MLLKLNILRQQKEKDLTRLIWLTLWGALIGAFTIPLTVYAVQFYLTGEPLWLSVAPNSAYPGYVMNPHYLLSNLALSIGPLLGCVASVIFLPPKNFHCEGVAVCFGMCTTGYFVMSFLGIVLHMKDGPSPYALCFASWILAVCVLTGTKPIMTRVQTRLNPLR